MEKLIKPMSGYLALLIAVFSFVAAIFSFANVEESSLYVVLGVVLMIATFFILKGLMIINPNHSRVLNFFGKYVGTVKENGLFFVNPLYSTIRISLRSDNLQGQTLKVNDKMGNPIEIGAVIVWQVGDTYKAAYDVSNYTSYVRTQSEAGVRHLAASLCVRTYEV